MIATTTINSMFVPTTHQRIPSDGSMQSPNCVMKLTSSPKRRYTMEEMHQSCCMMDFSSSSFDGPPMLPSRHSSTHGSDQGQAPLCSSPSARPPAHIECDRETSTCHLPPRLPTHSADSIVQVLLPGSPTKKRAVFTFSRSVSELPRAGASRRRRSSPCAVPPKRSPSDPSDVKSTSRRRRAPIYPMK